MLSPNLFVALVVTLCSGKHSSWHDFQLHAVNELKMSIRGTFINSKKLSLTSWARLVTKNTNEQKLPKKSKISL